jgi:hypothetical protein
MMRYPSWRRWIGRAEYEEVKALNRRIVRAAAGPILRRTGLIAAALVPAALFVSGVAAQTLSDPNPPAKWSPSQPAQSAAKSKPAAGTKSCSAYGAGFVNLPGTDTCVKIGGWATVQGSAGR